MNPLIKTLSIGAGGIAVAVAVFFTGVSSVNYPGAILTHLVDIIHGKTTTTVVSSNSPGWAIGQPLFTPVETSIATSSYADATSGLASSTLWYFKIAALDGNGTTTLSGPLSQLTDASTTQSKPEVLNIKWVGVAGATGYSVYFSTTTPSYDQYFYATTTGQFTFSTSTGSIAGTDTLTDGTAFSTLINPTGPSWIYGGNGTATSSVVASTTALRVNGPLAPVMTATTSSSVCVAATRGQMFYNVANDILWLCKSTGWTAVK